MAEQENNVGMRMTCRACRTVHRKGQSCPACLRAAETRRFLQANGVSTFEADVDDGKTCACGRPKKSEDKVCNTCKRGKPKGEAALRIVPDNNSPCCPRA